MHVPVAQKSCLFGTSGETCVKEQPTDLSHISSQEEGDGWSHSIKSRKNQEGKAIKKQGWEKRLLGG